MQEKKVQYNEWACHFDIIVWIRHFKNNFRFKIQIVPANHHRLFYLTSHNINTGIFLSSLWTRLFYKVKPICHFPLLSFCIYEPQHEHKSHFNHTKQSVKYTMNTYLYFVYLTTKVTQTTEENKRQDKKNSKVFGATIFSSHKKEIWFFSYR